jgi:hypothetical protein
MIKDLIAVEIHRATPNLSPDDRKPLSFTVFEVYLLFRILKVSNTHEWGCGRYDIKSLHAHSCQSMEDEHRLFPRPLS